MTCRDRIRSLLIEVDERLRAVPDTNGARRKLDEALRELAEPCRDPAARYQAALRRDAERIRPEGS